LDLSRGAARMRARPAGLLSPHRGWPPNSETARRGQVARRMLDEGCDLQAVRERLSKS
jgi:hypothetical protein